jgi:hypothetical protein
MFFPGMVRFNFPAKPAMIRWKTIELAGLIEVYTSIFSFLFDY